jgi:predicted transcriptional regulator
MQPISLKNIHPLDHFKRNTAEFRERLKETGQPEVLTVDGKAELVVQSAAAYEALLDRLDYVETLEGIREGLADADAGRLKPLDEAFEDIRREIDKRRKSKRSA